MLRFTFQHFLRHWRMNLVVWLTLLLAVVFLSSLPLYANAIASQTLGETLATAPPAGRNIEIRRQQGSLTAAIWAEMNATLGDLSRARIVIRETGENAVRSGPFIMVSEDTARPIFEEVFFRIWSFDGQASSVRILEGELPEYVEPDPNNLSYEEQEVAIGLEAAGGLGIEVGDQLRTADDRLRLNVVGLVAPNDPAEPIWLDNLVPFGLTRVERGNRPDLVNLSLFVSRQTIDRTFPEHDEYWRIVTNTDVVNMSNIEEMRRALVALESRWSDIVLDTALVSLMDQHLLDYATSRVTVLLLSVQSMIFVLYTITMVSSYMLDASRGEVSSMVDRGYTGGQISRLFGLEGLVIAFLLAAPFGPPLAYLLVTLWAGSEQTGGVPLLSWQLAFAAALFGWLALVIPVFLATRHSSLARQRRLARPHSRTGWQRAYVDFFLLALGALIYWQLLDTGSFLKLPIGSGAGDLADPLLLLGPSLLLIAVALLFLRFVPFLLRFASWLARQARGLILPFGLSRLARDPAGPSRVILLSSLAAALVFFAGAYEHTLALRQEQMALYNSGAGLLVGFPHDASEQQLQEVADLDGVQQASIAYRNDHIRWSIELGRQSALLAVDPETFPNVTSYPPAISQLTVPGLMPALTPTGRSAIPAIFSAEAYPSTKQIGDHIRYFIGSDPVVFEVRGIIINFPALTGPYIITDLSALEQEVDIDALMAPWDGRREVWLDVAPEKREAIIGEVKQRNDARVTGDAEELLRSVRANLPAAETMGAFRLNALILAVLSIAVFLVVHYFGASQRKSEFGVLRAEGLSARQLLGMLSLEGVLLIGLGILSGVIIGYILSIVMRPFFSRALSDAIAGGSLYTILVDWRRLLALYLLLVACYLLAMLISSLVLMRAGIHRTMRMGDE